MNTQPDTDLYLIECAGKINGRRCTWFAERDRNEMDFNATVAAIRSGQVENVLRVWCANPAAKMFTDATEEIAQAILFSLDHAPTGDLKDFLENALSCQTVAEFEREMEAA